MIPWWLSAAWAAPVIGEPIDPLQQCVETAGEVHQIDRPPPGSDRIAVVVGVPCHRHPSVPPLAYATQDALRVGAELEDRGYHVMRLTTLVDAADLEHALALASEAITDEGELVVYLSGHGVLLQEGPQLRRYLVMSDTDLTRVQQTGVPAERIEAAMGTARGARRVLVQDTCFASQPLGGADSLDSRSKGAWLPAPAPTAHPGDLRLYASQFFEQATESRSLGGSVYTHFLLASLDDPTSDLDGNGCVDLMEAHEASRQATSTHRHGFQNPTSEWADLASVRGTLSCAAPGTQPVLARPAGVDVQIDATELGPMAAVSAGAHEVTVRRGARTTHTPFVAEAGEWTDASQLVPSQHWQAHLRLSASLHPAPGLPAGSLGAELWGAAPLGQSLVMAGVEGGWSPSYDGAESCLTYQAQQVGGRAAVVLGRGPLKLGPSAGVGGVHRTARNQCRDLALQQGWGTDLRGTVHALWAPGPLSVGVDLGVDAVQFAAQSAPRWQVGPLARVSVGLWR